MSFRRNSWVYQAYGYPVSKNFLQKAVNDVIATYSNIQLKPITDSFNSKYYNDVDSYVTMEITKGEFVNDYTLRYGGSKELGIRLKRLLYLLLTLLIKKVMAEAKVMEGYPGFRISLRKKLINLFESEFIFNLGKELGVNHTELD